jgi:hypothetical protein
MYDYVDPTPKFRIMPSDYDWEEADEYVVEGKDRKLVVDQHTEGKTLPVVPVGYR